MINSLFTLILVLYSTQSFGQSTFEIKQLGNQYSQEQITQTFTSADFCGSYFVSKRNIIQLNDGSIVELKSQSELQALGVIMPTNCFLEDYVVYHPAIWSISSSGLLMKGIEAQPSPSEIKFKVIHQ